MVGGRPRRAVQAGPAVLSSVKARRVGDGTAESACCASACTHVQPNTTLTVSIVCLQVLANTRAAGLASGAPAVGVTDVPGGGGTLFLQHRGAAWGAQQQGRQSAPPADEQGGGSAGARQTWLGRLAAATPPATFIHFYSSLQGRRAALLFKQRQPPSPARCTCCPRRSR